MAPWKTCTGSRHSWHNALLQILNQFKTLEADLVDMQRYAAWKAADIRKALREGRTPTPGAPGDDLTAGNIASGTQICVK